MPYKKKTEQHKRDLLYYRKNKYHIKDRNSAYRSMRLYNITPKVYEEMFIEQKGLCAICNLPESRLKKDGSTQKLSIDHNHTTNEIRKLLCRKCNLALGSLDESPERARQLAAYIEGFK